MHHKDSDQKDQVTQSLAQGGKAVTCFTVLVCCAREPDRALNMHDIG
jgi:hypothetical protein